MIMRTCTKKKNKKTHIRITSTQHGHYEDNEYGEQEKHHKGQTDRQKTTMSKNGNEKDNANKNTS